MSVDYGDGVQVQPVFQDGGIDASEVLVGDEVALVQRLCPGVGVFSVHSVLDRRADGETGSCRAVVGAGAVVADATTELGEQEHDDVVVGVMLSEVVPEVGYGAGYICPEVIEGGHLGGVRVKAAVLV